MVDVGRTFADLDGIAVAAGPGLIGGVIVGLTTAKAIALVAEKPLAAVNHLEAHALTARLTDGVALGEAYDKTAKLLGLPYPGGPQVEQQALAGKGDRFAFPRPMLNKPN